ncbi:MAG: hypothetical protein AAGC45_04590 [Bacteroidota bacterium]
MGKYTFTVATMVLGMLCLGAQTTRRDKMLKDRKEFSDRTLFQQFEQKMIPTAKERKKKSDENKARRELLLTIIDTSQIKGELKQKLQYDVVQNPFSKRLRKFIEKYNLQEKISSTD